MPGLEITTATERFERLLGKYLEANTRDAGQLCIRKAKGVSIRLYKVCAKLAPSEDQIRQDVKKLGWRVRRPKGAWPLKKGEKRGSTGPLNRMRASQIGRRIKGRGSVAAGWLPAVYRFGGSATGGAKKLVQIRNPRGSVTIEGADTGSPRVTISNRMPGIVKMQREHNVVRTAFNQESGDIINYLRAKKNGRSGVTVGGNG